MAIDCLRETSHIRPFGVGWVIEMVLRKLAPRVVSTYVVRI